MFKNNVPTKLKIPSYFILLKVIQNLYSDSVISSCTSKHMSRKQLVFNLVATTDKFL
jgi:hypothetical protein